MVIGHVGIGNQNVGHGCHLVVGAHARVSALWDYVCIVQVAPFFVHGGHCVCVVNHANFGTRGAGQVCDGSCRQSTDPKEGVNLFVLQGIGRFGHTQALAGNVFLGVNASGFHQAEGHDFCGATSAASRNAFALQIGHGFDAGGFSGHHVHAVGVQHQQSFHIDLAAPEFLLALGRI